MIKRASWKRRLNLGTAASPSTLSRFRAENLTVYGTHDFTDRIELVDCIIDDAPAAEITKLNCIAINCALQGDISLDTSTDNLFDCCYSAVAGNGYPVCNATGAAGRGYGVAAGSPINYPGGSSI